MAARINVSDDEGSPPRYTGVFSIFNPAPARSGPPESECRIVALSSVPPPASSLLSAEWLCPFLSGGSFLLGPVALRLPHSTFQGDFAAAVVPPNFRAVGLCATSARYFWPLHFTATLNGHRLERPSARCSIRSEAFWLDLTPHLVAGLNHIHVAGDQPRGDGEYWFAIRICEAPSDQELVDRGPHAPLERWAELFRMAAVSDGDVKCERFVLSFVCPLGLWRISFPGRGARCLHLQCFDVATYLRYQRGIGDWKCPICSGRCEFEDIVVDECLLAALVQCPVECEAAEFNEDGERKFVERKPRGV